MSTVAPSVQPRNRQPRDWGNYASLADMPNGSGWLGGATASTPLEQGDTAFLIGTGRTYCMSAGTPGSLDAVWRVTGAQSIHVPVAASTLAGAGTSPVAYGAVWLLNGQIVQATSRALVGAVGGGTATVQVRRQSTSALVAGLSWSTAAALNDQTLALAVTIPADDWYVLEVVSDTVGAYAVVQGVLFNT